MAKIELEFIKQMYNKFKNTNEENIKFHVVTKFLEMVGYDPLEFYYEHSKYHKDGRADIAVKIDEVTYLYVEVKPTNNKLNEKEQSQLAQYLFDRGLSWGILTNGKNFILFNSSISVLPNPNRPLMIDKVVFNIDIFNKKHKELIGYFSKESIYENQISNYFRDIAKYKAIKYPDGGGSWNVYKGTLYNFFKYYAHQQKKYRELEQIRIDEFEDFLNYDMEVKSNKGSGREISSIDTFENKYSHIRSFFQILKEYNIIRSHHFEEQREKLIKKIDINGKDNEVKDILNEDNINLILEFYDNRKDALRNKTIFLLSLCFGLERSTLLNITENSVDKGKLHIGNRELLLPPRLKKLIEQLIKEKKQKKIKIKGDYLFPAKYRDQYRALSTHGINYIFEILEGIDKSNPNWSILSPSYIRGYLIKKLFENNYSIEEIVYLTGADLSSISKLIPTNHIMEKVKSRSKKDIKVHPFYQFLQ
ncbi:type I restriction enzyme HsdR N-terminal domain-containing protein [Alkalihalobacterium alkalinitrilicum]|uniref:type I restriction enzyme HsdR N-terminal domain-containing protein n=1 Tax=Alkalihalobacterium alkalinitrilicum TaxID=427920 RepID=UPI000995575B|nr:type I restriction enzyme HsdR N-terminal domain-containing protein [Alkalihalobacterium alkalinitrilicum]